MHRSTTPLGILGVASLGLVALMSAAEVPANGDPQAPVPAVVAQTPATPAPPSTTRPPRAPRAPSAVSPPGEVPTPAPAPEAELAPEVPGSMFERPEVLVRIRPRGKFGFAFQCEECSADTGNVTPVWRFTLRPRVYTVESGTPAARAGFRRGDVITRIDGVSILSPEGGRMFGATRPGQTVRWTVLRAGESRELVATATEWPDRRERIVLRDLEEKMKRLNEVSDLDEMHREVRELTREIDRYRRQEQNRARIEQRAKQQGRLRYAGVVGDAEVEVRGSSRVLISESPEKDRVVINLGESVVVIQLAGHTPKKKADSQK